MSWQDYFTSRVLDKGYEYYDYDRIIEYHHHDDVIDAKVKGTKLYSIRIELKQLKTSTCSCGKECCKHMAGALYKYEEEKQDQYIDSLVDDLDEVQVKDLMKYILKRFPNVYDTVFAFEDNDEEALYQFIESDEDFTDLEAYLKSLDDLINLGFYDQVFNKISDILYNLEQNTELSEDEAYHLIYSCIETINHIMSSPIENSLINKIQYWIDKEKGYYEKEYGIQLNREIGME